MIAMAISCNPELLIADEPTTALDVTIQAQILDLLATLQDEMGMGLLFITHDMGVVAEIADKVAIMYLGDVVEQGDVFDIFERPMHPYTQALINSVPTVTSKADRRRIASIGGSVPPLSHRPKGCGFCTRCSEALPNCATDIPQVTFHGEAHYSLCHLYQQHAKAEMSQ